MSYILCWQSQVKLASLTLFPGDLQITGQFYLIGGIKQANSITSTKGTTKYVVIFHIHVRRGVSFSLQIRHILKENDQKKKRWTLERLKMTKWGLVLVLNQHIWLCNILNLQLSYLFTIILFLFPGRRQKIYIHFCDSVMRFFPTLKFEITCLF